MTSVFDDSYPLPRIEELIVRQGRKKIHSVMDLKDGFHQIPLAKESRIITGTITPLGLFHSRILPMGWMNGVQYMQRNVEHSLRDVDDVACGNVDDILIGTSYDMADGGHDGEDDMYALLMKHDYDLRRTLEACRANRLQVSKSKCQFFVREVEFCGHLLSGGIRRPAPGKLLALAKWELPNTLKALRGFLGFTNYYAGYVEGYAKIAAPIQDMLKKPQGGEQNPRLVWTEEAIHAFDAVKEALQARLRLNVVDLDKPYILRTDASGNAIGAVLEQPNL